MRGWRAGVVVLGLLATACSRLGSPQPDSADAAATRGPRCTPAALEARAGRALIVGLPDVISPLDPLIDEVLDAGVSGVLLTHGNFSSAVQFTSLVRAIKSHPHSPVFVAVDEEPGRVRTFESLFGSLPSARRLASEKTVAGVQDVARTSGAAMARLGVNVDFAPVADVDGGPWNGLIGDRSFSDDPTEAAEYALAYARGLQQGGVTPVIKHFPGHGRSYEDAHEEMPRVSAPLSVLRQTDVHPFKTAVDAGAPVVMMGHVAYAALDPSTPASLSASSYRLLRELGFRGAAITDSIGMGAVNLKWDFDAAAVKAVAAGADGVLATDGRQATRMRDALVAAVRNGALDEERLNEAAGRMMALAGGDPTTIACRTTTLPALRTSAP